MAAPRVHLIGPPRLIEPTGHVAPLTARQAQLLLLLALRADGLCPREEAVALLWGAGEQAGASARQFLKRLREGPLAGLVEVQPAALRLSAPPQAIDLLALRQAARTDAARARALLESCEGALLHEVPSPTDGFEEALREARAELDALRHAIALAWLDDATRYGRPEPALLARIGQLVTRHAPDPAAAAGLVRRRAEAFAPVQTLPRRSVPAIAAAPPPAAPHWPGESLPRLALCRPRIEKGLASRLPCLRFVGELAERLTVFRSFAVIAPHSSFKLGRNVAAQRETMNADYALDCSFTLGSDGVSFALSLIAAAGEHIVWSARLPLSEEDLAPMMSRAGRLIARTLAAVIERDRLKQSQDVRRTDGFLLYLRARDMQQRCDLPDVRRARRLFGEALEADPSLAIAHAKIAETLVTEWILRGGKDGELLVKARDHADEARVIDPGGAAGHWMSGSVALYQRDYDHVVSPFEDAESLAPHAADLLLDFADARSLLGETALAEQTFARALDLNPAPPDRYWWFGASIALSCGDFELAARRCEQIESEEAAVGMRTISYAMIGESEKAEYWAGRLRAVLPGFTADELTDLMPCQRDSELYRNYREGLRRAGFK